ncbi:MAG: 4Fe-4S dicluster domain-containing protein [Thermoanaerobaculia bacterium]
MARYGFLVDLNYCVSCKACEIACKTWNEVPVDRNLRWRRVIDEEFGVSPRVEAYSVSLACNHCADAPCVKACPNGAITVRPDGIVQQDPSKCLGCRYCAAVCPYGAPQYDAVLNKVFKCNMCFDRIDAGETPACAQTCPTGALQWGKLEDIDYRGVREIPHFPDPDVTNPSIRFVTKED